MQIYNPDFVQRYEFEVSENGKVYDTAHHYQPLSDERYLQFIKAFNIRGNESEIKSEQHEAINSLWNDLVNVVENIEVGENDDWQSLIDIKEKEDSLNTFLAVAIVEPEEKAVGKRKLSANSTNTVITEAYFNNEPCQQTHVLQSKSLEWQKKYDRIQQRQFKEEKTKGLRRKPQIEFVPQDEAIGNLYDEMLISTEGFLENKVPIRFKTAVIRYIFGSKIDEKK